MPKQIFRCDAKATLPQRGDDVNGQDRIAADLEEIVLDPHLVDTDDTSPDLGHGRLQRAARRDVRLGVAAARCLHPCQGATVDLAQGCQWQSPQRHQHSRHHVVGQLAFQELTQFGRGDRCVRADHVVACQTAVAERVFHRNDRSVLHRWVLGQYLLDLARLDPEAPQLHLLVDAAEELDRAIAEPPAQVTRAVHAAR